jgi:hypothetical protein
MHNDESAHVYYAFHEHPYISDTCALIAQENNEKYTFCLKYG